MTSVVPNTIRAEPEADVAQNDERMRCAVIVDSGQPLDVTTQPRPVAPEEGCLLRTLYAGVCHSDLHFLEDNLVVGEGKVFRHRDVLGELLRARWIACRLGSSTFTSALL